MMDGGSIQRRNAMRRNALDHHRLTKRITRAKFVARPSASYLIYLTMRTNASTAETGL